MDRNEKDKDLNFIYKEQTDDEKFLDKVIRAETKGTISEEQESSDDSTSKKKITRDEIIKSAMEQAKSSKRDDGRKVFGPES